MCAPSQGVMLPYGLKIPSPYFPFGPSGSLPQVHLSALDFQRSQLNEYNVRVQLGLRNYQNSIGLSPFQAYINDPYTQAYFYKHDPRARFVQEEPKPSHSYIGLIGMAILNSKEKKLVLSDIYQWILDNYPYFRTRGPGWRNSIRHNLSLNDCFIKAGRSANGKGHYWAVHPANVEDFERGDFRRRRAQRKVRRHMGLSVPDDDDSPTPSPTQPWPHHDMTPEHDRAHLDTTLPMNDPNVRQAAPGETDHLIMPHHRPTYGPMSGYPRKPKKRLFDMASLLAPDEDDEIDIGKDLNSPGGGPQGQLIPSYLHPMTHLTPHDLKIERNSLSSHSSDFSGPTPTQDLTLDVSSCKDVTYESDDDLDNDEIHVTSGENSPSREMDDCDMDQDNLDNSDYLIRNKKDFSSQDLMTPRSYDSTKTSSPCNPATGTKPDNALDLTSQTPAPSSTDRKDMCFAKIGENLHFLPKMSAHNSGVKDNCKKHEVSQRDGETNVGVEQDASTSTDQSRHDGEEMGSMRQSYLSVKNGVEEEEQEFTTTQADPSGRDQPRHSSENAHFYRPDLHELKRQQSIRGYEATFNVLDCNHGLDSDRGPVDVRRVGAERTSPLSDMMRVTADTLRWADLTKPAGSVDRVSAFSSLNARNHNMYSPFQIRNFSLPPHRLLQSVVPVRGGGPQTLLTGAPVPHSMPVMKGLEAYTNSGVTSNNPSLTISNHNSTSRTSGRD